MTRNLVKASVDALLLTLRAIVECNLLRMSDNAGMGKPEISLQLLFNRRVYFYA